MHKEFQYDAFVSYSHADCGSIAPEIQKQVENLGKPWWRFRRSLNLYRDVTNLSADPHLWGSILSALEQSEYLILLASPRSASSQWVSKEVTWWLDNRSAENIIIVLVTGTIVWEGIDFAWDRTDSLPTCLKNAFGEEPVFVPISPRELYKTKKEFSAVLRAGSIKIVARITKRLPREVESDENTRKKNIITALSASVLVLILAFALALFYFLEAKKQAKQTMGLYLASESDKTIPVRGVQLLLNAWSMNQSDIVWSKLFSVFNNESILSHELDGEIDAISGKFGKILISPDSNTIELRDFRTQKIAEIKHTRWIMGAKFHPDKESFLTYSQDSSARLWTFDGQCKGSIKHPEPIAEGFISSSGTHLILSSKNYLTISDMDGRSVKTLKIAHDGSGFRNEFSPDGKSVMVQTSKSVIIFDTAGVIRDELHPTVPIRRAKISQVSGQVIIVANDGSLTIHTVKGNKKAFKRTREPALNVFSSSKEDFLVSVHDGNKIYFWDYSGRQLGSRQLGQKIFSVQFSSNGLYCLVSAGNSATLLDRKGEVLATYPHSGEIWEAKFSQDDRLVVTCSRDRTACLWALSGIKLKTFRHEDHVYNVDFLADTLLVTRYLPGKTRLWEIEKLSDNYGHLDSKIVNFKYRADLKRLLLVTADSVTRIFSESGSLVVKIKNPAMPTCFDFSSASLTFTAYAQNDSVTVWDQHGKEIYKVDSGSPVTTIDVSPDGKYFLAYGDMGTVNVWHTSGKPALKIAQGNGSIGNIIKSEFLNSGEVLTKYYDGRVSISSINGKPEKLYNYPDGINNAAINGQGDKLVSFSYLEDNYFIRIRDLKTGATDSIRHSDLINAVTFSPDGRSVVSAASDDTSKIWFFDKIAGDKVVALPHAWDVRNAKFSPDGQTVLTYTDDGFSVFLWNLHGTQKAILPAQDLNTDHEILFTPDSKKLVSFDSTRVYFWNLGGSKVSELEVGQEIISIQFSKSPSAMLVITSHGVRRWIWPDDMAIWATHNPNKIPALPQPVKKLYGL